MTSIQAHRYREALTEEFKQALAPGFGIEFMTNGAVITFWRNDTGLTLANFSHTDEEDDIERARR